MPKEIREILRNAVRESSVHGPDVSFDDDTQLLAEGIIDSIGIFSIMSHIEEKLDYVLAPDEITAENFRSINALSARVQRLVDSAVVSKELRQ